MLALAMSWKQRVTRSVPKPAFASFHLLGEGNTGRQMEQIRATLSTVLGLDWGNTDMLWKNLSLGKATAWLVQGTHYLERQDVFCFLLCNRQLKQGAMFFKNINFKHLLTFADAPCSRVALHIINTFQCASHLFWGQHKDCSSCGFSLSVFGHP